MINVVHLQTHLPSSGNAAFRLHTELIRKGVNSHMLSLSADVSTTNRIQVLKKRAEVTSIVNQKLEKAKVKETLPEFGMFSYPVIGNNISKHPLVQNADVLYLHWAIGGFLGFKNFHQLAKLNKPIIVFMHDMWSITGGCHYSFTCDNFIKDCANCQVFSDARKNDLSIKGFNQKQKFYNSYSNLHFLSPSKWLFNLAEKAALTRGKDIRYIPNVIGKEPFKKIDKTVARTLLNLNAKDTIVAFGAAAPSSPYKGWHYLKEALDILAKKLNKEEVTVAIFGSNHNQEIAEAIPFKTVFLGRLGDDYSTTLVYNAADVFVAPSLAETFGLVVLEALRCGTPVAAFNTGGIPDIVEHKKNGYLAKYKDAKDLAEGIKYCLDEKSLVGYGSKQFDADTIIDDHIALCEELLGKT